MNNRFNQYPSTMSTHQPLATQQSPANYPTGAIDPLYSSASMPMQSASAPAQLNTSNELVRAATPLITLITQIRHTVNHPNVATLRAQVIEEIKLFESKLASINYPLRTLIASRYCLCTAIDEAVLEQPWGTQSVWVQNTLLNIIQKETWGGERFYIILEDALRDIRSNIDFIEFIYYLLSLGFEGKFFGEEYRAAREETRNRIFYHIRHARTKPERSLSPHWKNIQTPESVQQKKVFLKRISLCSLAFTLLMALIYNIRVYHAASPTIDKLNDLANVSPVTTFSNVVGRQIIVRNPEEEGE